MGRCYWLAIFSMLLSPPLNHRANSTLIVAGLLVAWSKSWKKGKFGEKFGEKFYLPEISHDGKSDSWKCRGQGRWWTWFSYFFQHYIKDFLQQLCSLIWLEELNRATETNFNQLPPAIQKQDFWLDELIFPIRLLNPSQHLENDQSSFMTHRHDCTCSTSFSSSSRFPAPSTCGANSIFISWCNRIKSTILSLVHFDASNWTTFMSSSSVLGGSGNACDMSIRRKMSMINIDETFSPFKRVISW